MATPVVRQPLPASDHTVINPQTSWRKQAGTVMTPMIKPTPMPRKPATEKTITATLITKWMRGVVRCG